MTKRSPETQAKSAYFKRYVILKALAALWVLSFSFFIHAEEALDFYEFAKAPEETILPHKINIDFLKTKGELGGWIQLDKNWFLDSPVPEVQHPIRRLRFYITTTSRDLLTLMLMVQGDQDYWRYHYLYADVLKPKFFQLRIGLCKKPFSLEALYSSRYLWMVNRSLGTINYLDLLDIGIVAYGFLLKNTMEYGIGVYNGNERNLKNNPHKIFCSRLVLIPWENSHDNRLKQLRFGSSFSTCQKYEKLSMSSFSTGSGTSFLSWNGNQTKAKTGKILFGGDIEWLYGPAALRGEFLLVNWGKVSDTFISRSFSGYSWYVQGSYFLTGEKQQHNKPLLPTSNFNICHGGGAFEILGRYEAFQADHKVVKARLATGSTYVSSFTMAANYYFNPFILTRFDWQVSNFHRKIVVKNRNVRHESVLTCRLQGEF